ncbi:DNA-processing protein DprA [Lutispora saccharofermentans]|uniref:DNA-processing protein DprA n=1 Tax=Lutispora saccharofermentans TaxID=3024236 RepID=A0ABT1N9U3_9FIRM|nr:DNA-processing protein DprA [Lutispora saccharofermentans]MCQ1528013.1 DNA-processing protein DprA [Lutispora saccharofermentans]
MEDKKYSLWLSGLPQIGSRRYTALIKYFGSAKRVFESSRNELFESGILNGKLIDLIISKRDIDKIDRYLKKVKENDIKVYTIDEESYPQNLKNIYDPPPVLYVRGNIESGDECAIAVVGSRKASDYGLKTGERLGMELAEAGITVISGMALGIDSAAHRGALKAGGRTIAVFACGLNYVYPKGNYNLAKKIIKHGAIISEYPLGIAAAPQNFPARNRIISGMSKGVVIVEANEKSGSLITADFALEQGRDVFAVPGNIGAPNSRGTNELIKNGAKLVSCIDDILEEYGIQTIDFKTSASSEAFDEIEQSILTFISGSGRSMDEIIEHLGSETGLILSKTVQLEIKGRIKEIDGIYYGC